jgi:hypothetical protein
MYFSFIEFFIKVILEINDKIRRINAELLHLGFEVLMLVNMLFVVFWIMMSCSLVGGCIAGTWATRTYRGLCPMVGFGISDLEPSYLLYN